MSRTIVSLRDVVEPKAGLRNPAIAPQDPFTYVDVAAIDNEEKRIVAARVLLGSEAPSRARKLMRRNDVLVSTVRPNLNAVAIVPDELDGHIASTGLCVLRAKECALPEYLYFYVRSKVFVDGLCKLVAGAMYPAVTDSQVLSQPLPLPSLREQRRIVDLLGRAEGIVRLRREAQQKAAELIPAIFIDMFGDPATNPKGWPQKPLSSVAEVISGVAKGRKLDPREAVELPYMRVGNVKDGYLDLDEVKTIEIKSSEVERLRIEPGDLLMTEGGDPDKLGRAALWRGEIDLCVHQNHVFKVRTDRSKLSPEYLRSLAGSAYGKAYFLSVAKKTTGIASINKTQLSAFPVLLPPLNEQHVFAKHVVSAEAIARKQAEATASAQVTFDALLAQAFGLTPC
ncbi:MAG TPA: restriction endonuclease subunit S [Rubrivivax sp.]|nr:restriction endonuclease subunit S [Rubrivivax sp.]